MFDSAEQATEDIPGCISTVAADAARLAFEEAQLAQVRCCLAMAEFQASGEWKYHGHRSAVGALVNELGLDRSTTATLGALGRKLAKMPFTRDALLSGEITIAHAQKLAKCLRRDLVDMFNTEDGELFLVGKAIELVFTEFAQVVTQWIDVHGNDDHEAKLEERKATCDVRVTDEYDGTTRVEAKLPPVEGDVYRKELKRLEILEFDRDWAEAVERLGAKIGINDLARTPQERRVAAQHQMSLRSAAYDGDPLTPRLVVNVLVDQETLDIEINRRFGDKSLTHKNPMRTCRTLDGTSLLPADILDAVLAGRVRRVVQDCNGSITDIGHSKALFSPKELEAGTEITEDSIHERFRTRVLTSKSHQLNYGRTKRLFEGIQRLAVQIKYSRCTHEHGCLVPSTECEIDHHTDWQDHGKTDVKNGRPLCKRHNLFKQNTRHRRNRAGRAAPPTRIPVTPRK